MACCAASAVPRIEPDHGRVRGQLQGPLVAPRGPELRRLSRSKPQLPGHREVQHHDVSVSGASQPTRTRLQTSRPTFSRSSASNRSWDGISARRREKRGRPHRSRQLRILEAEPRIAADLSQSHLKIDGAIFSVIGVLPAGFRFPAGVDLWLPADLEGENPSRTSHNYPRSRASATVLPSSRRMRISAIARRIHETTSEQNDYLLKDGIVISLQDRSRKARPPLLVLLGAVGFLLLVRARTSRICCSRKRPCDNGNLRFAARSARRANV